MVRNLALMCYSTVIVFKPTASPYLQALGHEEQLTASSVVLLPYHPRRPNYAIATTFGEHIRPCLLHSRSLQLRRKKQCMRHDGEPTTAGTDWHLPDSERIHLWTVRSNRWLTDPEKNRSHAKHR